MPETSDASGAEPRRIQTFQYHKPPGQVTPRAEVELCGNALVRGTAHVILKGEADDMHFQAGADEFWMVLNGNARVFGPRRTLIGEFGADEGLLIPRETKYFIENIGDRDLELLQIAVVHAGATDERVDVLGTGEKPQPVDRHSGRAL